NRDDILDIARNSLEALGYWPVPELEPMPEPAPEAAAPLQAGTPPVAEALGEAPAAQPEATFEAPQPAVPAAPATPPPAPAAPPPPAHAPAPVGTGTAGGFELTGEQIDDGIREIFLEEFEEEIANLRDMLPEWREAPDDLDRLRPIRRVFHTLKGSGRLVGARTLGEFAWKTENMLNRVLDGSRPPSPAVMALVTQSYETLPQLLSALRGEGSLVADLAAIEAVADRVAAGEEAFNTSTAATAAAAEPEAPAASEPAVEAASAPAQEPAGEPANVDQVLLEILDAEIAGHLVTVDQWLAGARMAPAQADDSLLRAIHTM